MYVCTIVNDRNKMYLAGKWLMLLVTQTPVDVWA